jgi:hypothetical protein
VCPTRSLLPPLLLVALLAACARDPVRLDPAGDTGTTLADSAETESVPTDTGPTDSTRTDSTRTDTAPLDSGDTAEASIPLYDPPAGTFVDPFAVTLALEKGEVAWYTTDGTLPSDTSTAYTKPISVSTTVEIRVLRRDIDGVETFHSKSYVQLDPALAASTSNLPLVVMVSKRPLEAADRDYLPLSFQVHDRGEDGRAPLLGEASMSHRAAIKVRGSSTAYDAKHSWALELRETYSDEDDAEAILDMPAESDWVLYAPLDFDRALIRNALMYRLSNDIGRYAPRTRFVEVYAAGRGAAVTDGDYQGVYVLMERISIGPDRVAIPALTEADVVEPAVTGGYLFKRDRVGDGESGFNAGTAGGTFSFADPLVYVDPDEDEIVPAQAAYLTDVIDDFADALVAPDHTHDGVPYTDMIDQDAWIDNHILYLYAKNPDALRLSSHMYKEREGPLVAGPIWDFDRSMGCTDDSRASDPTWWDATNITSDTTPMFTYGWYQALFDDPAFNAAYWVRFAELMDDTLSDAHVNAVIDEMAAEIGEAAPRNYARWSGYGPTTGSFEGEIQALKDWFATRHAWSVECLELYPSDPRECTG